MFMRSIQGLPKLHDHGILKACIIPNAALPPQRTDMGSTALTPH